HALSLELEEFIRTKYVRRFFLEPAQKETHAVEIQQAIRVRHAPLISLFLSLLPSFSSSSSPSPSLISLRAAISLPSTVSSRAAAIRISRSRARRARTRSRRSTWLPNSARSSADS